MHVVVTGAGGYLGGRVAADLAARAHRVERFGRAEGQDLLAGPPRWSGGDVLVHAAGVMSATPLVAVDTVRMAVNLLSNVPDSIRRLVLVSSAYVYAPSDVPATELTPPAPQDPYGHAKLAVEELFAGFASATGRALVVLRPCAIVGPGEPHGKAVTKFAANARRGVAPTLGGPVRFARDYVHVADAARAVALAAEREVTGTFNVCTGAAWSAEEVAAMVMELVPALPKIVPSAPLPAGYRFDPERAARELDFRAAYDLRRVLAELILEVPA